MFWNSRAFGRHAVLWQRGIRSVVVVIDLLLVLAGMVYLLFLALVLQILLRRLPFVCPALCVLEEIKLRGQFATIDF
jgi:hypothetical protein